MILEIITCEKPQRRHVFVGAEYDNLIKNEDDTWTVKINDNGTVSAEHGIGKIKCSYLKMMYGEKGISQMKKIKAFFDPDNLLNPGNLFPE